MGWEMCNYLDWELTVLVSRQALRVAASQSNTAFDDKPNTTSTGLCIERFPLPDKTLPTSCHSNGSLARLPTKYPHPFLLKFGVPHIFCFPCYPIRRPGIKRKHLQGGPFAVFRCCQDHASSPSPQNENVWFCSTYRLVTYGFHRCRSSLNTVIFASFGHIR